MRAIALVLAIGIPAMAAGQAPEGEAGAFAERREEFEGLVDEDEQYARPQVYAFNPVQARNELKVGNYYAKKGNHRAAAGRYLEATRWDANFGEAYWRLGQAREHLDQAAEAAEAYARFLELKPEGKRSRQARRRLLSLQQELEQLPLAAADAGRNTSP